MIASGATVAVLGGSGLIGRAIVDELAAQAFTPIVVDRGLTRPPALLPPRAHHLRADRSDGRAYRAALQALDVEAVIDVTGYRDADVTLVGEAFRSRIALGLHLGTVSSYRPPLPTPIPESWPLLTGTEESYPGGKAACERVLDGLPAREAPWCRLRLPAVMGPGDPASREAAWAGAIASREAIAIPGGADWLLQAIPATDVARVCVHLLRVHVDLAGSAVNVAGPPFTLRRYIETMAGLLGVRPPTIAAAPASGLESSDRAWPHAHGANLVMDTTMLRRLLPDFTFTPLAEALAAATLDRHSGGPWFIPTEPP